MSPLLLLPLLLLLLLLQTRGQLSGINWNNAVIIIDEAHNIQVICAPCIGISNEPLVGSCMGFTTPG
jgi:hypothetical protein